MPPTEAETSEITWTIWKTVLDLTVQRTNGQWPVGTAESLLTGCVLIAGAWKGAVILDCTETLARRVTGIMFGVDPARATEDEIRDALGELTSITGGNIKGLMPGPSTLSMPAVVAGRDYRLIVPGSRRLSRVSFACEEDALVVTVVQRQEDPRPPGAGEWDA